MTESLGGKVARTDKTIAAVFAGHDHDGGCIIDSYGVAHITLESPLEAADGTEPYAVIEVFEDRFTVLRNKQLECYTL